MFTEAETLERGIAAQTLMNDTTFQSIFHELVNGAVADAFATDPKDWKVREDRYQLVRATKAMVNSLQERVNIARVLQEAIELRDQEEGAETPTEE